MNSKQAELDADQIQVRPLKGLEDLRKCVEMQRRVWGFDAVDILPQRFFVLVGLTGGQLFGAFHPTWDMIGFLSSVAARKPDGLSYLHSQMMAVLPEFRNKGVARKLKLAQRQGALDQGYSLIEWTFDPLELKNAYFNIERLGVIVRRYLVNVYGHTTSRLQAGLPTDRLVAEWWISSQRVRCTLGEVERSKDKDEEQSIRRIELPANVTVWKMREPEKAAKIQSTVRQEFQDLLGQGLAVTRFERGNEKCAYILTQIKSKM